jgi:large subunit ribosomal protein L18
MSDHVTKQMKQKRERRARAHRRLRARVRGTEERPRLAVYKSLKYIYAQVIDDSRGVTIAQASSADPDVRGTLAGNASDASNAADAGNAGNPGAAEGEAGEGKAVEGKAGAAKRGTASQAAAKLVGEKVAERAKAKGVQKVVFDRGGYIYHGKVKAVAEAAREKGLQF